MVRDCLLHSSQYSASAETSDGFLGLLHAAADRPKVRGRQSAKASTLRGWAVVAASHLLSCCIERVGGRDTGYDLDTLQVQHQQLPHGQDTAHVLLDQLLCKAVLIYLTGHPQFRISVCGRMVCSAVCLPFIASYGYLQAARHAVTVQQPHFCC
jgi:hypothetical protein